MKRRELIRYLEAHGREFLREGSDHTVYVNRTAQKNIDDSKTHRDQRFPCAEDLSGLTNTSALR